MTTKKSDKHSSRRSSISQRSAPLSEEITCSERGEPMMLEYPHPGGHGPFTPSSSAAPTVISSSSSRHSSASHSGGSRHESRSRSRSRSRSSLERRSAHCSCRHHRGSSRSGSKVTPSTVFSSRRQSRAPFSSSNASLTSSAPPSLVANEWAAANIPSCTHGPSHYLCDEHHDQYIHLTRNIAWGPNNQGPGIEIATSPERSVVPFNPTIATIVDDDDDNKTTTTRRLPAGTRGPNGVVVTIMQPVYWKRSANDTAISEREMLAIDMSGRDIDHCCVCDGRSATISPKFRF